MKLSSLASIIPSGKNLLLAVVSALLLTAAFPDFEYWFLAWFALVPLMWAVEREKASNGRSFLLGWLFGTIFFFGSCWWLTYAPIRYAGFSPILAYLLLFCATAVVGVFPGVFTLILSILHQRFGSWAILAAPFVWAATEFTRYWLTGNNWNAIGYSQAFAYPINFLASIGGVLFVSFFILYTNCMLFLLLLKQQNRFQITASQKVFILITGLIFVSYLGYRSIFQNQYANSAVDNIVVAVQPNVPMSGLNFDKWRQLRQRQIELAEAEIKKLREQQIPKNDLPTTVILPESPMNYMYTDDPEFRSFINNFAIRNNVSVLFNAAEPDTANKKNFNSAVMINAQGSEVAQYDKIYLLPFGESVPFPLRAIIPAFVGSFSYGNEYDLLPFGDAKAGVVICFESHFGGLSREYVRRGADAIIEMTNDGYLGPTPVLRQHLANAVLRAVETNRPVFRVTNVGITAYINERGEILDQPPTPYQEATRVWSMSKSDGSQTFYVKYGDWFAWVCTVLTIGLLVFGFRRNPVNK